MDYDYDSYGNELGEYEYREEEEDLDRGEMTFDQTFQQCVLPTLNQTLNIFYKLFLWNVIFRLSSQVLPVPNLLQHMLSLICGLLCLYSMFPTSYHLLLIVPCACYLPLRLLKTRGASVLMICGAFLVVCELLWLEPRLWHQIRGPQMILVMKAVSLAFDLDLGPVKDVPGIFQYCGYMLCPGNCIFGPWTSYLDYEEIFKSPRWRFSWLKHVVISSILSLFFLTVSTCWVYYIFSDSNWKWIMAYRDALSFRSSHYFVCYISQTTLLLCGYSKLRQDDEVSVVHPLHVEMPRSLIQVVVSWNLPMHSWLKIYVFNTTLHLGNFFAVLFTYTASALLHGLNFQLAAVLLSLGLYSYVEFMLRKKLAAIFSSCVLARPCKADCSHSYKWNHAGVLGVNAFFMMISLLHLAYLGVVFQDAESSDSGFSYQHTLAQWSKLGYLSHYLALLTYIVFFLI